MKRALLLLGLAWSLLLLGGCGDPLVTTYGSTEDGSVNGVRVLKAAWMSAFQTREVGRLSSRLDHYDLLVHLQVGETLPNQASCDWIRSWLEASDGRQFVLVLRDGGVAAWLCRRWASEARAEAAKAGGDEGERLLRLAMVLDERALREGDVPLLTAGEKTTCPLFTITGRPTLEAKAIIGVGSGDAPPTMRLSSEITAPEAEPLITIDDGVSVHRPWAVSVPVGESRLIVVANATPLLDAALVDRNARRLLDALTADLRSFHDKAGATGPAGWVRALTVREKDAPPPNILALLFGRPPFSWAVLHLCALAVVILGFRAAWLGRITTPPARTGERFSRHVDALASHLASAGANRACTAALSQHWGVTTESQPATVEEARAIAASLHRPETGKHRRTRKPKEPTV